MNSLFPGIIAAVLIASVVMPSACSNKDTEMIASKVSSQLLTQVNLRKAQISDPTAERLAAMREMGMNVTDLGIQRIFIHLNQTLTPSKGAELKTLGITLYLDSWIPPVGNNPTGFLLADMPIGSLAALTGKDFVVRLETAERQLQPQNQAQPQ